MATPSKNDRWCYGSGTTNMTLESIVELFVKTRGYFGLLSYLEDALYVLPHSFDLVHKWNEMRRLTGRFTTHIVVTVTVAYNH